MLAKGVFYLLEITDNEIKILEYIKTNKNVSTEQLKAMFPEIDAIDLRVKRMYLYKNPSPLLKSNVIETVHVYNLTEQGLKALQDHALYKKKRTRELWLKNAWIPIIVSVTTTLLTHYILPWLIQILKSATCSLL